MISLQVFWCFYIVFIIWFASIIFNYIYTHIPAFVILLICTVGLQYYVMNSKYAEDIGNSQYIQCIDDKKFIIGKNSNTYVPESTPCINKIYTYDEAIKDESKSFVLVR